MIQYNTSNKSFLKLHYVLKKMGIKNNTFFLELKNPLLLNINPRDENLPFEIKILVNQEIQQNIWYFVREVVRIPTGGSEIQFKAHKLSIAVLWCLLNNLNTIIQGPRQCGKTTGVAIFYLWLFYWGAKNTQMALYSISEELLKTNISRIKDIRSALPKYLQLVSKMDQDNASLMRINRADGTFNVIRIKASGKSEEAARNVGRGHSTACQWYDEFAFIEHVQAQFETAVFAYSSVAREAAKHKAPHHICLSTTAGFLDTEHGQWAYSMIQDAAPFNETLYDMVYVDKDKNIKTDEKKVWNYIKSSSSGAKTSGMGAFVSIEYMYYDLDVNENYLEEMRSLVKSEDAFRREVLMEWRSTSSDHPLGQERVAQLQKLIKKPIHITLIDNLYALNFYKDLNDIDFDFPYICGMDIGSNTGSDFSALVIVDPRTFEVVATIRTNHHTTPKFVRAVKYILHNIFINSVIIVERNGVGGPIAQMLDADLPPSRMYRDEREIPGIALTRPLRDLLFNEILKASVMEEMYKIHDKHIISEIVTLKMKNGRIDHEDGKHDDTLISYLYCKWFLSFCPTRGKYIDPIFIGVNRNNMMSKEQMSDLMKDTLEGYKEEIIKFAKGNRMPKFKPMEDSFEKIRKQDEYLRDTLRNPGYYNSPDTLMQKWYKEAEERERKEYANVSAYDITNESLEDYYKDSSEDKIDTEELNKNLQRDEEINRKRSDLFKASFKAGSSNSCSHDF